MDAFILYLSTQSLAISGPRSTIFAVVEFPSMMHPLKYLRSLRVESKGRRRRSTGWRIEALEARTLLALDFTSVVGVGADLVTPEKTAVDAAGNAYVTGSFQGQQVSFGAGKPAISSGNTPNIFVAKYSPTGTLLWVDQFADDESQPSSLNLASSLAVDDAGEVFVTGTISGHVNFSTNPAVPDIITAMTQDIFALKLDPNGNMIAVQAYGGSGLNAGLNIKVDPSGQNVVLTGSFESSVDFNPGGNNAEDTLTDASGTQGAFALKLDGGLGFIWARNLANGATAAGTGVDLGPAGDVYVVGTYSGTGNFNPDPGGSFPLSSGGPTRDFVEKLDPSGNFLAAGSFGLVPPMNSNFIETPTIAVDALGNAYISGNFQGQGVNFDPSLTSSNTQDSAGGTVDVFVVKLDPSLNLVWKTRFGGSGVDSATNVSDQNGGIGLDGSGNVYVGGTFTSPASVGANLGVVVLSPINPTSTEP